MKMLLAIKSELEHWQNRDLSQIPYQDHRDKLRVMISRSGDWILAGDLPLTKMQRSSQLQKLHENGLIDRGLDLRGRKNEKRIVPVDPDDQRRKIYVRLTAKGYKALGLTHQQST